MKISGKAFRAYLARLRKVDATATEALRQYIVRSGGMPETYAEAQALIEAVFGITTKYGEAAAAVAAEMYDAIAAASAAAVAPAIPAETATIAEVAKAVTGTLKSRNEEIVASAVERMVKMAGVDTMMQNALRDGAEWAWIPAGDTCAYCITLASRGWQRASKRAIKNGHAEHVHGNCDCTYAVRFDRSTDVEGYDPDAYLRWYDSSGGSPTDKINAMRRELYAENRDEINAQKRAAYAARKERNG